MHSEHVKDLFSSIAGRYRLTNHLLSGGIDCWWRHCVAKKVQQWNPSRLLDVATGNGDLAFAIAKKSPTTEIIALDFCPEMLREASLTQAKKKHSAITFLEGNGLVLPFKDQTFDVVTISFGLRNMTYPSSGLPLSSEPPTSSEEENLMKEQSKSNVRRYNMASWEHGIREMHRVLRPGGYLLILDFSIPTSPLLRPCYRFYLHQILPRFAGWLTGRSDAYEYMGGSIEAFPAGEEMISLLHQCDFLTATATAMTFGIVSLYTGKKEILNSLSA